MAFIVAHSQILLRHAFQFCDTCNPAGSLHFSSLHKHTFLALLCEFEHPPNYLAFPPSSVKIFYLSFIQYTD